MISCSPRSPPWPSGSRPFSGRRGSPSVPSLSLGLSTAALGTLGLIAVCYPLLPRTERVQFSRKNFGYFLISAFFSTLSHFAFFAALQRGPLFTVAPLVYTSPLFVLVFSWLWFRQAEGLSFRLAAGVVLICAWGGSRGDVAGVKSSARFRGSSPREHRFGAAGARPD